MKNLWLIMCLLAVFTACSDEERVGDDGFLFTPITGLNIPVRVNVEEEVYVEGKGFAADCEIWLQLNGGDKIQADVVRVDENGVTFTVAVANSGFYAVILVQGGKEYRIGGINLVTNDLEPDQIEAYAVRGEMAPVVYPVSVSGKTVGKPLFEMRSGYYFGTAVSTAQGKVYYSGFDSRYDATTQMTKMVYYIDYYDTRTQKRGTVSTSRVNEYFAMGLIEDELHVLFTSDQENFDLVKLGDDGTSTLVHTFPLASLAGKIWSDGLTFVHDPQRGVIYLNAYLKGENPVGKSYVLDLNTGNAKVMDGGSKRFSTLLVDGEVYYFCRELMDEDNYMMTIWHPADPLNWNFNDPVALVGTLEKMEFNSPFYNSEKHVFYGIGEDEVIYTWNPASPTAKPSQWVKTGCEYLFKINSDNN